MTDDERKALLKKISFAIGLCQSIKPEEKARIALEASEEGYELKSIA